jgi:lactate 2-monooxygenase
VSEPRGHVYLTGAEPWPVSFEEWEQAAQAALPKRAFDYVAAGAGDESTVRNNRAAFDRWRLRPRMMTGKTTRDLSVKILKTRSSVPLFLAPVGVQGILHDDGDIASARAAALLGIPFITSSAGSFSIEEIADAMGDAARWFQLYWVEEWDIAASLVKRAEAAGYSAIVLTVDTLTLGYRHRDVRNMYLPFVEGDGIAQFTSDPVFRSHLERTPEEDPQAAGAEMVKIFPNLALKWSDLEWLRNQTSLPLIVKGILRGDDARRAFDAGADGVIVSNHGGRQVTGAIASLDALVEVRDELGPEATVLMDGGIRQGSDILKAVALGADAVLIGRPYVYALAVAGQAGVEQLLRSLMLDLDLTAALVGISRTSEINRDLVTH